jgi:peptidoglycan/LPS O-acetylase OafA/YrhL
MAHSISVGEGLERREDNFLLLRIIAALLVIYGHSFAITSHGDVADIFVSAGWRIYSGDIAVNMFFLISGFMVSGSYARQPDLVEFMKARILRIVPAYAACLILLAFVMGPLLSTVPWKQYVHDSATIDYVARNLMFSSDMRFTLPGVFADHPQKGIVNGSLWTLPAEFRMYVFAALLGATGLLLHQRVLLGLIIGLLVVGIFAPYNLPLHPSWLRPAGYFAIGVLIFAFKDEINISTAGFVALAFTAFLCRGLEVYLFVLALAMAYFCFWFAYIPRLPKLDRWGDPSYAIYLWGWPIQQMYVSAFPNMGPHGNCFVSMVTAIMAGYLSWYLVEKPFLRLKRVFSRKSSVAIGRSL